MPLNAGDRLGGYEVIALFGEGPSTHSTSSGSTVGGVEPSASALSTGGAAERSQGSAPLDFAQGRQAAVKALVLEP